MPSKCAAFWKGQDQLGHGVVINYRKEAGFGTILGGLCSFATIWKLVASSSTKCLTANEGRFL